MAAINNLKGIIVLNIKLIQTSFNALLVHLVTFWIPEMVTLCVLRVIKGASAKASAIVHHALLILTIV